MTACIKKFIIEIKSIGDDLKKIVDHSDYTFNAISDLEKSEFEVKIKTPSKEDFKVKLKPCLGGFFSLKEENLCDLIDGIYKAEVISCSGIKLTYNIPFMENMENTIDDQLLKTKNESYFLSLKNELEIVKTLYKHGVEEQASEKYSDIEDRIRGCMS